MPPQSAEEVEVSVVMPCLNEEKTVGTCIRQAQDGLKAVGVRGEVIVSDNGSTDRSVEIAESLGARVVHQPLKGYGSALRKGFEEARGRYLVMGDADMSYDFGELPRFIEKLREGNDLVMGSRFKGEIKPGAMPWKHKWIGNPVLSWLGRLLFRTTVSDFHCGLRAFTKQAYERMNVRTTGMEFASEIVVKASLLRMRITEVPITLYKDGRSRPSHLRSWRDGWRHLRFLLLYSPRWLFLYPGLALILLGTLAALWLVFSPIKIGRVAFDINTLMYACLAILIGFQSVAFAVFTKVFAILEGLLPEDPLIDRAVQYITLETGLIVGGILLLVGLAGSVYALGDWGARSFGSLNPSHTMRIVIPSVTTLALGVQVILSSFFLSVLGLRRKRS